jgi:hypothetical protein
MHKSATKCNETLSKWCKNKHGASKIIDTFETYQALAGSTNHLFSDIPALDYMLAITIYVGPLLICWRPFPLLEVIPAGPEDIPDRPYSQLGRAGT